MDTKLQKDKSKIEDEWFLNEDLPVGALAVIAGSVLLTFLLGLALGWRDMTFLEGIQKVVLLGGFAVYLGRQGFDIPWMYLVASYKERYQTLAEQQQIAFEKTKHLARTMALIGLGCTLYFFHENITLFWSIPVAILLTVFPIIYRIFANKAKQAVEKRQNKIPVKRMSADGKIDLTDLPFVFEDLEKHHILNGQVKEAYQEVQGLLDYVTRRVAFIEDVEVVHTLKRMGEEELPRLLRDYEALEAEQQEMYSEKMLEYLELVEAKLQEYREMIDQKNAQNIQTTFSLFDERYRA